jgi:uncharacterized protein YkwD
VKPAAAAPAAAATPKVAKPAAATTTAATTKVARPKVALHRHPTLVGMLRRNNDVRRRLGLRAHRLNPALTKAAQDHANYMARTAQFSHYVNGGPQYRAGKYGFRGGVLENIAYGSRSVNSTFAMWEGSSGHYASIVSGTTDAGFGYAIAPNGQCYWVGVYANPTKGDAVGETEQQIAAALAAEKKALADAAAKVDPNVAPASATEPVEESTSANAAAEAPAGAE